MDAKGVKEAKEFEVRADIGEESEVVRIPGGNSTGSDLAERSEAGGEVLDAVTDHADGISQAEIPDLEYESELLDIEAEGPSEGEDRSDLKPEFNRYRLQRSLIGFLFALSFYFIEAGLAEILLAQNATCVESLTEFRLSPDPFEACMSEFGYFASRSISRGFIGVNAPSLLAWPVMGVFYALIGGGLAQFSRRRAVGAFLLLQVIIVAVLTSIGYLSQFIV
jgi:hypothetical protein